MRIPVTIFFSLLASVVSGETRALPEAGLVVRFGSPWQVVTRSEQKGAHVTQLFLSNETEQRSLAVITPRVGERAGSLEELADLFAAYVDDVPAPKKSKIDFFGRDAILIRGVFTSQSSAVRRSRVIVVFFCGGEEWAVAYSGPADADPGLQDILTLVEASK